MKADEEQLTLFSKEKVGIVLATYNPQIDYFREQIKSIERQSFQNWICYIVDDCSRLEYQELIEEITAIDKRFICKFHEINLGSYHNFERGLQYCAQDQQITAIAFCDQDDIWQENKLSTLLEEMRSQQAVLVHSDLELINTHNETLHPSCWEFEGRFPEKATTELLLLRNTVTGCSLLFCASLLPLILPFPNQSKVVWHHDLWVTLIASCFGKVVHVRRPLVKYRQHSSNVVGVMSDFGTFRYELRVWLKHRKGRLTNENYLAYQELRQALVSRCQEHPAVTQQFLSCNEGFEANNRFFSLVMHNLKIGYRAEGIALHLAIAKLIIDTSETAKSIFRIPLKLKVYLKPIYKKLVHRL